MRAALYARISTRQQNLDTQLLRLTEYAEGRRFQALPIYSDTISSSRERRPGLDELMRDAKLKRFDVVVVVRFDRFARSTRELIGALEEFQALGIDFISLSEAIDTSTHAGKLVFAVLGAVAELERNIIRERISAGIDRARKQGKQLGRPKRIVDVDQLTRLRAKNLSLRAIAELSGVDKETVRLRLEAGLKTPLRNFSTPIENRPVN